MKKKLLVLMLVAIFPLKAFNQISQGSIVVGGAFGLSVTTNETEQDGNTEDGPKTTEFSIVPDVEYFLADNLSAGIGIGYIFDKTKKEAANTETIDKTGTVVVYPYLKKYFSLGEKAYFFGKAQIGLGFGKNTTETKMQNISTSIEKDHSEFSIGIIPGFRYDVNEKIGLEAGIGFLGYTSEVDKSGSGNNEVKDKTNTIGFTFVPNAITFGIRFTIN